MNQQNGNFFFEFDTEKKKLRSNKLFDKLGLLGCSGCPLLSGCNSPKMKPYGKNKLSIAIVGESPGEVEDIKGKPFKGNSGDLIREELNRYSIDMDEDCITTNVVQCFPSKKIDKYIIKRCLPRLDRQLRKIRPNLIIALGGVAMEALLEPPIGIGISPTKFRGRIIPSKRFNAWVGCMYHPSFILRNNKKDIGVFQRDLEKILEYSLKNYSKLSNNGYFP